MGHYSSFILRLWIEPPDGVRWGIIQHVATQEKLRFQAVGDGSIAVADVIEFIRKHSEEGETSLPFVLEGSMPSQDGAGPTVAARDGGEAVGEVGDTSQDGTGPSGVTESHHDDEAGITEKQP